MLVLLGVAGEGNHFTPLLQLGTSLRIASDQQNWQHRLSSSCIRVLCAALFQVKSQGTLCQAQGWPELSGAVPAAGAVLTASTAPG